jgi:hypothetical protein
MTGDSICIRWDGFTGRAAIPPAEPGGPLRTLEFRAAPPGEGESVWLLEVSAPVSAAYRFGETADDVRQFAGDVLAEFLAARLPHGSIPATWAARHEPGDGGPVPG